MDPRARSHNIRKQPIDAFRHNWGWFLTWGIIFVILGMIAIYASVLTTLASIYLLGILLLVSSFVLIMDASKFWWGSWGGFFLHFLMSIFYFAAGIMLIQNPILGSISITLLLGILYISLGIFRVLYSLSLRTPRWGWNLFNGLISFLLGLAILYSWPASSLFIIGLFVGIDLLFCGWAYIMSALSTRAIT